MTRENQSSPAGLPVCLGERTCEIPCPGHNQVIIAKITRSDTAKRNHCLIDRGHHVWVHPSGEKTSTDRIDEKADCIKGVFTASQMLLRPVLQGVADREYCNRTFFQGMPESAHKVSCFCEPFPHVKRASDHNSIILPWIFDIGDRTDSHLVSCTLQFPSDDPGDISG